jgi:MSHA biogenesis protein MshG
MTAYTCKSRDPSGTVVERTIDAASRSAAIGLLERDGLFPVSVTEAAQAGGPPPPGASPAFQPGRRRSDRKIKRKELMGFSVQLNSSLIAGVPILTALRSIRKQTADKRFEAVLGDLLVDIEGGLSLSGAMQNYPKAFPQVYTRTVAAGEQSGSLDQMLGNLADHLEAEIETRADVRTALMYPVIVISVLCAAISVLIVFVVPRFTDFYSGFGAELPLPTRILIATSDLFSKYGLLAPFVLAGLGYGFLRLVRTRIGRSVLDRALLRTPLVGHMIETAITLHTVQILGLSCRAGVPLLESLRVIATSTGNGVIRSRIEAVTAQVTAGSTLADSMEAAGCFPPSARQMMASGEATGSLERSCFVVAKHFKKELHYLTKNLAIFIEPLLTLFLAVIVLFIALAVFLPMWDLVKVVKK